jgi:hypothetical protein
MERLRERAKIRWEKPVFVENCSQALDAREVKGLEYFFDCGPGKIA